MIYEGCNLYSSNLAATLIFVFLCSVNEIYRGERKSAAICSPCLL